jgi:hypothetical protein
VTVNDQEARKERIVLANCPSWRLAHPPVFDDHGNVVVDALDFDSSSVMGVTMVSYHLPPLPRHF